jgi:hypothetical protein
MEFEARDDSSLLRGKTGPRQADYPTGGASFNVIPKRVCLRKRNSQ